MSGPKLATHHYAERGIPHRIDVFGGLQYLRGNKAPYFSLTCWYGTPRELARGDGSGGAAHDTIREHFGDRFDDLAALHLSDINGVPMYALENGFFRFYDDGGYRGTKPTWEARVALIADHFRISADRVERDLLPLMGDHYSKVAGTFLSAGAKAEAKARLADWTESQRERWKAEADACIAKHELVVYGDAWVAP